MAGATAIPALNARAPRSGWRCTSSASRRSPEGKKAVQRGGLVMSQKSIDRKKLLKLGLGGAGAALVAAPTAGAASEAPERSLPARPS